MDVKLDSLIEKIRKEGIEEAEQKAESIIKEAKQKAASIVDNAKKEAEKLVEDGKKQVDQYRETSEVNLKQTARNIELLLKEKINSVFDSVFKREIDESMKPDFLKDMITKIVDTWAKDSKAEIVLNEKEKDQLENVLFSAVRKDLKDSITIRLSNDISNGFRIGLKGQEVYYDFTDDSIAEVLKSLINPKLKEILDK